MKKATIVKMFHLCRVSNPRPLHHGANALPLGYEGQSNLRIILFNLNHTAANGVFTEFYHINWT